MFNLFACEWQLHTIHLCILTVPLTLAVRYAYFRWFVFSAYSSKAQLNFVVGQAECSYCYSVVLQYLAAVAFVAAVAAVDFADFAVVSADPAVASFAVVAASAGQSAAAAAFADQPVISAVVVSADPVVASAAVAVAVSAGPAVG